MSRLANVATTNATTETYHPTEKTFIILSPPPPSSKASIVENNVDATERLFLRDNLNLDAQTGV